MIFEELAAELINKIRDSWQLRDTPCYERAIVCEGVYARTNEAIRFAGCDYTRFAGRKWMGFKSRRTTQYRRRS